MNAALLLIGSAILFSLAYAIYGRYLARMFGVDASRPTPAETQEDGIDYVSTRPLVLFGHHFASIAGAGPILGPIMAAYFGWGAVAIWILIGCIFIGAVHDFSSLFISVRNGGRSIAHTIEGQLGYGARQAFLLFAWSALVLVVAIFAKAVAGTVVERPSVATASVLFITMAPVYGWLVSRRGLSTLVGSLIFVPLLFACVWIGGAFPLDLTRLMGIDKESATVVWVVLLLGYAFVASVVPVWVLLQPRDYLNSYLLYAMMLVGFVGIVVAHPHLEMPAFSGWVATAPKGGSYAIFPLLFVTVACGAISGFHSLVASGTTAKQLDSERHILAVGYGSMLVEGLLAIMALISVAVLGGDGYRTTFLERGPVNAFASGLAGMTEVLGLPPDKGATFIALAISAFMLTTLDTATRLTRFTWQELFLPRAGQPDNHSIMARLASNRMAAAGVAVVLALLLAQSGTAGEIWPVFGASNQLLAALALMVVAIYLWRRAKPWWLAGLPAVFMMVVCLLALFDLLRQKLQPVMGALMSDDGDVAAAVAATPWPLVVATLFLLVMAIVLTLRALLHGADRNPDTMETP